MVIKVYQQNKQGIETFAIRVDGSNIVDKIASALFELGTTQKKWQAKGVRFSGFALSKPVYFYANGKAFNAKLSASLRIRLKFRESLSIEGYKELVNDLVRVIGL